jgi:hypothetical protein
MSANHSFIENFSLRFLEVIVLFGGCLSLLPALADFSFFLSFFLIMFVSLSR